MMRGGADVAMLASTGVQRFARLPAPALLLRSLVPHRPWTSGLGIKNTCIRGMAGLNGRSILSFLRNLHYCGS